MADLDNRHIGWITAWSAVLVLCGGGAVAAGLQANATTSTFLITLVCLLGAIAIVGLYMCFAPLLNLWPVRRTQVTPPASATPAVTAGVIPALVPVDVTITSTQRADWLLLNVQNNGATARFSAEVLIILRKELSGVIEPSWWPVPWIADGQTGASIAPSEIPTGQTRILDFATHDPNAGQPVTSGIYEALTNLSIGRRGGSDSEKAADIVHKGETVHLTEDEARGFMDPKRHRVRVIRPVSDASLSACASGPPDWHFASAPLPIMVRYWPPIKSLHDLSGRRFVMTVRISRSEPTGHADRTFEVGIGAGQALICEPAALKVTILDRDWQDWHLSHFIVSIRVRIENTTARTIQLAPVFWLESEPRDVPPPDRDDPQAIRQDIVKEQERLTPSLFDRLEIPPHDSIRLCLSGHANVLSA